MVFLRLMRWILSLPRKIRNLAASITVPLIRFIQNTVLPELVKWKQPVEEPKVAVHKHRGFALLRVSFHLVSLTAALFLIAINIRGFFIGSIAQSAVSAIQFTAKVLELLSQASIAMILLTLARDNLIGAEQLALGAWLATLRTTDVSCLWSLELWGFLTSSDTRRWRKLALAALILSFVVLAALIGPSSAVLMIPRIDIFATSDFLVLADGNTTLFPAMMDMTYTNLFNETNLRRSLSDLITIQQENEVFSLYDDLGYRDFQSEVSLNPTTLVQTFRSTVPTRWLSRAVGLIRLELVLPELYDYVSKKKIPHTTKVDVLVTESLQPIVQATYNTTLWDGTGDPRDSYVSFVSKDIDLNHFISISEARDRMKATSNSANSSIVFCRNVPPNFLNNHSLLLVSASTFPNRPGIHAQGWTIDAFWGNASVNTSQSRSGTSFELDQSLWQKPGSTPIAIAAEWAEHLISHALEPYGGLQNPQNIIVHQLYPDRLLALGLADALYVPVDKNGSIAGATVGAYHTADNVDSQLGLPFLSQLQKHALSQYIITSKMDRKFSNIYVVTTTNWTDPATLTHQYFHGYRQGYGYNSSGITVQLCLAVVGLYCTIVVAYVLYTILTGRTSDSWNSVREVLMLGLVSQPPSHLGKLSAGAETLTTFQEPVSVKVTPGDELSLVFVNDPALTTITYTDIEVNKAY